MLTTTLDRKAGDDIESVPGFWARARGDDTGLILGEADLG